MRETFQPARERLGSIAFIHVGALLCFALLFALLASCLLASIKYKSESQK
jgi:hypothetical protein